MKSLLNKISIYISLLGAIVLFGCDANNGPYIPDPDAKKEVRIAVVLDKKNHEYWKKVLDWAKVNISAASDYVPVYEFYDENDPDLSTIAYELAHNDSIVSVIGCEKEGPTDILAHQLGRLKRDLPTDTLKPMFTFNSSDKVLRKYGTIGSIWGLVESDITQSEIILSYLATYYEFIGDFGSSVALLASNGSYGQSFIDWFAFQSRELGLKPQTVLTYDTIDEIPQVLDKLEENHYTNIVAAPNSEEEAVEIAKYSNPSWVYFTSRGITKSVYDKALANISDPEQKKEFRMGGIQIIANPESGFNTLYETKYGSKPKQGEAHLYDAVMITCLSKALADERGISVNEAVTELLSIGKQVQSTWTPSQMKLVFDEISSGETPAIGGASGHLIFNPKHTTIIKYSVYALTSIFNDEIIHNDYFSREPITNKNSSLFTAWEWNKIFEDIYSEEQEDIKYPTLEGIKALIVATSKGWNNYRHQADALDFYQTLKRYGYKEEEIILIAEDDLANNPLNPYPGVIQSMYDGPNLYENLHIDYKLSDLTPEDFKNILLGKSSEKLPTVLETGIHDNILLFISGHGLDNILMWGDDNSTMNGNYVRGIFQEMHNLQRYRNILCVMETCYSGSVAKKCEGIPGILFMTAANEYESSKAIYFDNNRNTYLSNSFTTSFIRAIDDDDNMSIRDFYYETYNMTMGSHVSLYNVENFDNLYTSNIYDFLIPRVY